MITLLVAFTALCLMYMLLFQLSFVAARRVLKPRQVRKAMTRIRWGLFFFAIISGAGMMII